MIEKELRAKHVPNSLVKKLRNCGYLSPEPNLGEMLDWLEQKYQLSISVKLADKDKETWFAKIVSKSPKLKGFEFDYIEKPLPYIDAIFEALKKIDMLHQLIDLDDYSHADI